MLNVNGTEIDAARIAAQAESFADAPDPEGAARRALAARVLLLQRAIELGLNTGVGQEAEDEAINAVLDREVLTPEPAEEECRRHYTAHAHRYRSGDLVQASHILFAVTAQVPLAAVRAKAEAVLGEARREPARFARLAHEYSNCPSAAQDGNLGQLGRGDAVPEFERALFDANVVGVLPRLVTTRYGFHIVLVERRIAGRQLPFEQVAPAIAAHLVEQVQRRALAQYMSMLAGSARIEGADLGASASPLLQ